MTHTNPAELPDVVEDAFGRQYRKSDTQGVQWSLPAPPGAVPRRVPFAVVARSGPLTDPATGLVIAERPADDLTAAEIWQREHEDQTGHQTWRTNSWSGGTGVVQCNGLGLDRCDQTFTYRNTRDHRQEATP